MAENNLISSSNSSRNRTGIRRARAQLSCVPCRQGKLKCDRAQPACEQCRKRCKDDACSYLAPPSKIDAAQNIKGRIRHLESLVVGLINERDSKASSSSPGSQNSSTADSRRADTDEPNALSSVLGQLVIDGSEQATYVGSASWEAILNELKDFAEYVCDDDEDEDQNNLQSEESLYSSARISFGIPIASSKHELIAQLPARAVVDNLVDSWFNGFDPFQPVVHRGTFMKEYLRFWEEPGNVSYMWLALLFGIMSIATILMLRDDLDELIAPGAAKQQAEYWQQLCSSAITLGDVAKGLPHTMEALLIYAEVEFLRNDERQDRLWLIIGVTLRVALKMGYHRDPDHFPNISPFQGEMRRRVWNMLYLVEVLSAFSVGLPSSVRLISSDTKGAGNYEDIDLTPSMTRLPPQRPHDEITAISYIRAKSSLCKTFGGAMDASHAIVPLSLFEVMEMDVMMAKTMETLPMPMQIQPLTAMSVSPSTLIYRYNLRFLYLKCRCMLHRRYFRNSETLKSESSQSRKLCAEAALEILQHQRDIWHACRLGGPMYTVRWYLSYLTTYDFLLAAMVISLAFCRSKTSHDFDEPGFREKCIDSLRALHNMWTTQERPSNNVLKASRFLAVMLQRATTSGAHSDPLQQQNITDANGDSQQWSSAGPTVAVTSEQSFNDMPSFPNSDNGDVVSSVGGMLDLSMEIDWSFWDESVNNQTNLIAGDSIPQQWAMPFPNPAAQSNDYLLQADLWNHLP